MNLAKMVPTTDESICSIAFCLINLGQECLIYQPDSKKEIPTSLEIGTYEGEIFDTIDPLVSGLKSVKSRKLLIINTSTPFFDFPI